MSAGLARIRRLSAESFDLRLAGDVARARMVEAVIDRLVWDLERVGRADEAFAAEHAHEDDDGAQLVLFALPSRSARRIA